jgi:4-aminobutyrate aminotransferase-like enzyme
VLRLVPPLNITDTDVHDAVDILKELL